MALLDAASLDDLTRRHRRPPWRPQAARAVPGLRPPAQEALAVEVGLAARHGAGVVLVLVELQREERLARRLAHVVLDVRVRAALEVGHVDDVQVLLVAHVARRLQDLAPVVPVHVGHDRIDVDALDGQEVERDDVDAVELAQLARDVHVDALVVHVVRPADEDDAELAGLLERVQRLAAGVEQRLAELVLADVGAVERARAAAPAQRRAARPCRRGRAPGPRGRRGSARAGRGTCRGAPPGPGRCAPRRAASDPRGRRASCTPRTRSLR